jgi:protein-arginine kinase activator protein McsA
MTNVKLSEKQKEVMNPKNGIGKWLIEYFRIREQIDEVQARKIACVKKNKFEFAAAFRDKEKLLWRKYKNLRAKIVSNIPTPPIKSKNEPLK